MTKSHALENKYKEEAKKELKKVSIESVRSRMKDAEKEGLTYDEYCAKYRLHKELSLI